jgi:catechol 2,3-dioxygenase-like lactoylglutathione lyase family enzyme
MIKGIDHLDIGVNDLEKCVKDLQDMGFKVLRRIDHHGGTVQLQCPGINQPIFELHPVGADGVWDARVNHIAFRVDDIQETYDDLTSKGLVFTSRPKFVKDTGRTNCNLDDPNNRSSSEQGAPNNSRKIWGWVLQLVDEETKPAK